MNEIKNNLLKYKEYIINQFKTNRKRSITISVCTFLVICGGFYTVSNSNKRKVLKIREAIYKNFRRNQNEVVSNCIADVFTTNIIRRNIIDIGYKVEVQKISLESLPKNESNEYTIMFMDSTPSLQICYK